MEPITDERLKKLCAPLPDRRKPVAALARVRAMGELARWWLDPAVLALAAQADRNLAAWTQPHAPRAAVGMCVVVFVNEAPGERPLLRPAVLLPLRWERGREHSARLPVHLAEVARKVVATIEGEGVPGIRNEGWGLHLALPDDPDLSGIRMPSSGSSWVSLAGGLIVAAEGEPPDLSVWATGEWDPVGGVFAPLDGLQGKLALATEYRTSRVFVPPALVTQAREIAGSTGPEIAALDDRSRHLHKAIEPFVVALLQKPARTDPIPKRARHFVRLSRIDRDRARAYYVDDLLSDIASECATRLAARWRDRPSHLVTIASDNWEQVPQTALVVRPRYCLVLYTPGKEEQLQQALKATRRFLPQCDLRERRFTLGDDLFAQLASCVQGFGEGEAGRLALDLTPGNKEMSLALAFAARPGNQLIYVRHKLDESVVVPFSQDFLVYTVGDPQSFRPARPLPAT
jgi:hypothetical protein